ncbi:MAG TPA: 30S ribosomal protein S1 [Myxococcales bacterium]|nr:30S ribosomal protein S1 [Myxococcales bacterium]
MTEVDVASGPVSLPDLDDEHSFEQLIEEYLRSESIREGEIYQGKILDIGKDFVTVDIGYKSEGQISRDEFISVDGTLSIEVGGVIDVFLERRENDSGLVELSKEKADRLKIWDQISDACERDELVEGVITGRVKGGLTVDIGVKAFLPGSQVDLRPVRNLDKYISETYKFKVIKFNKKRGNIVLSRRALLEKEREHLKKNTLDKIQVGMTVEGIVKNITEYGCFVDLGGIDGLLHITDMSWGRVNHPSEMFQVGDEIEVRVLKFDSGAERVSLGLKQITEDPWLTVDSKYQVGQRVNGSVVSMAEYGAFIELERGIEGLIHVSEMSWTKRVKHPSKVVSAGDVLEAVILDIDTKAKRISLGMKQVEVNPWTLLADRYPIGSHIRARVRNVTNFGVFVGIEEGIDGLIHVSDLSWSGKVKDPREVYEKGTEIEAAVLNIDVDNQRFSLGVKQLGRDPWETVESRYPIGQVVEGVVNKILDFGAIVGLELEIEGLVHISEISHEKIEHVGKVLDEGQKVRAKVISLIPAERKIGLSIKRLLEHEASAEYQEFIDNQSTSPTTLGDLILDKIDIDSLPEGKLEPIIVPDFNADRDEEDESSEMQDPGPVAASDSDDDVATSEASEAEVEAAEAAPEVKEAKTEASDTGDKAASSDE